MRASTLLLSALFLCAAAQAQSFDLITSSADAGGVSEDGQVVVGSNGNLGAFRWQNGTRFTLPGLGPTDRGPNVSQAFGVSADGRVAVGSAFRDTEFGPQGLPVRWRDGSIQVLPTPPTEGTPSSSAIAASADGNVVVGTAYISLQLYRATRWVGSARTALPPLSGDNLSAASDVSNDGSVITGISFSFNTSTGVTSPVRAVRWVNGAVENLHPAAWTESQALGVSEDGQTVVGWASRGTTLNREFIIWLWRDGTRTEITPPPRWFGSGFKSLHISGNGAVLATANSDPAPYVWTAAEGWTEVVPLLTDAGVDLQGYVPRSITAISNDGTTIVGRATTIGSFRAYRAALQPVLAIVAPENDEVVPPGEPYEIRFTAPGSATVDLYLVTNAQADDGNPRTLIAEDVPVTGAPYEWDVPEDLLSPSTFLVAVDTDDPSRETVSARFRVRNPGQLTRVIGTIANPEYEPFRFARHSLPFDQSDENLWPRAYWDRDENAYDDNVSGYDPLIPPIGDVRYDEGYFGLRGTDSHPTWEAFARAFGFTGAYASTGTAEFEGVTVHQVNPSAASNWRHLTGLNDSYSGACYGFSMAVLAGFGSPDAFSARWLPLTGSPTLADVSLSDEARDAIHALYSYQFERRHLARINELTVSDPVTPREVLEQLKARFASDNRSLDRVLGFYGSFEGLSGVPESGGHAVAPVGLEDVLELGNGSELGEEDDGVYYAVVVDPNYGPTDSRGYPALIRLDSTASTWEHLRIDGTASDWIGVNTTKLFLAGLASDALESAIPSWPILFEDAPPPQPRATRPLARRQDDPLRVRVAGGDVGLTGPGGEVSYRDGLLTETLPSGGALFPLTGRPSQPYALVAPLGRYTVDLAPGASGQSLLEVGDRRALGFQRLDGSAGAPADVMAVGGDTLSAFAGSAGLLRMNARLTVESSGGAVARTFAADSLLAQAGVGVGVSTLADSTGFGIGSDAEVTYDLVLGQAGAGGRRSFYHANVTLPAGASHVVQPDWPTLGDGPVTVFVDLDGDGKPDETFELTNEGFPVTNEDEASTLPAAFALGAYPNPARGIATIEVALPEATDVRAEVYDLLGRRVAVLHDGLLAAGTHPLALDAARLPAGVYVVRAVTPEALLTQRFTVVR